MRFKSVPTLAFWHHIPKIWERIVNSSSAHWLPTFMLSCTCTDKSGHQNARYKQSWEQFAGSSQACQLLYYWPYHIPAGPSRSPAADSSCPWGSSPAHGTWAHTGPALQSHQPPTDKSWALSAFLSVHVRPVGILHLLGCYRMSICLIPNFPVFNLNSPFVRQRQKS